MSTRKADSASGAPAWSTTLGGWRRPGSAPRAEAVTGRTGSPRPSRGWTPARTAPRRPRHGTAPTGRGEGPDPARPSARRERGCRAPRRSHTPARPDCVARLTSGVPTYPGRRSGPRVESPAPRQTCSPRPRPRSSARWRRRSGPRTRSATGSCTPPGHAARRNLPADRTRSPSPRQRPALPRWHGSASTSPTPTARASRPPGRREWWC